MIKISAIIPCFNDCHQLGQIVGELAKCKQLCEIIVVDDGSNPPTKAILSGLTLVRLITHKTNRGKSQALLTGITAATGDVLIFIDADLQNFSAHHVNVLIKRYSDQHYDMVLGLREKEFWFTQWLGFAQAYTGERMINKAYLTSHSELFNLDTYLIEPAINRLFFHNYKVGTVKLRNVSQKYKIQKQGLVGLLNDFKMYRDYLNFLGLNEMIFQMNFAKKLGK